jgi:hypothetical protein
MYYLNLFLSYCLISIFGLQIQSIMLLILRLFDAIDCTCSQTRSRNCEKEESALIATWRSSEQRGRKHVRNFIITYTFGATNAILYIEQRKPIQFK